MSSPLTDVVFTINLQGHCYNINTFHSAPLDKTRAPLPACTPRSFITMSDGSAEVEGVREETKSTVDPVKSFLSGGFGGVSCVLVGHPFDLTCVSAALHVQQVR